MRKKVVKHFSLKRLFVLGAISFALPAFTAVPVSAAETASTVTLEDIEQKRKNMEDAQKEYDMALADRHAAEDLVENARRARDDAQEQYDICIEKYKKGFSGFLQWVIDTEEDPLKVEDARSTLALLQERGETDEISPLSPRNITRMYFTAQWLDEYADFLEQYEDRGLTATTSHDLMNWTQDTVSFSTEDLYEEYYSPHLELRQLGTFAEDKDGIPVLEHSETEYNRSTGLSMRIDDDEWLLRGHTTLAYIQRIDDTESVIAVGLSTRVNPVTGENLSLDYVNSGGDKEPYTLREYARALRDYYALVDPLPYKAAVDGFDDEKKKKKRELISSEELVSSKLSRLKGAQKDYEEAVAQYNVNTVLPEESAADPVIITTSLTAGDISLHMPNENTSAAIYNTADEMPVYAETRVGNSSSIYASEAVSTGIAAFAETVSIPYMTNYTVSESEPSSEIENKTFNEASPISHITSAKSPEIALSDAEPLNHASTSSKFAYKDTAVEKDNTKKPAEEQNGILMRVLSYIFNGGAIAVIIPAGFRRRKKDQFIGVIL